MEETKPDPGSQSHMGSYKLAKLLQVYDVQKKALTSQVEDLKVQLQSAKTHINTKEEKASEHPATLENQNTETERLHLHMEEMNKALQSSTRESAAHQQRLESMLCTQLNNIQKELYETISQLMEPLKIRAQTEQQRLQEIQDIVSNVKTEKEMQLLNAAYEAEKEKNAAIQQQLGQIQRHMKQQDRFHAERALADLHLIRELRAAKDHLQDQQNKVSERTASTTEDSDTPSPGQGTAELLELGTEVSQQAMDPVPDLQVPELLREVGATEENLPTKTKPPTWRRLNNFLGLKKKKRNLEKPHSN